MKRSGQSVGHIIQVSFMLMFVVWMGMIFLGMAGYTIPWSITSTFWSVGAGAGLILVFLFFYVPWRESSKNVAPILAALVLRCPKCSAEVSIDAEFCPRCKTGLPPRRPNPEQHPIG